MSPQETLEEFQARFSSLEEQSTSASKRNSEIYPSTPPPTQQVKRSLQSPMTPYHGGSRKVFILEDLLTLDASS
jgi:hypothetical protein